VRPGHSLQFSELISGTRDNASAARLKSPASDGGCESHATVVAVSECSVDLAVRRAACQGCNGRCLGQLLNSGPQQPVRIQRRQLATPADNFEVGESLKLTVTGTTLIGLSSLAYLLPVVVMLLFAVGCYSFASQLDFAVAGMALIGLILGLVCCNLFSRWYSHDSAPRIRAVRTV
jgi:positive regulator of sigma E activity